VHSHDARRPLPIAWGLHETAQAVELLDAAPWVVEHCCERGTPAPDPLGLCAYAEEWAGWCRDAAGHSDERAAGLLHSRAGQLDAAADRLWRAMVQRDS